MLLLDYIPLLHPTHRPYNTAAAAVLVVVGDIAHIAVRIAVVHIVAVQTVDRTVVDNAAVANSQLLPVVAHAAAAAAVHDHPYPHY